MFFNVFNFYKERSLIPVIFLCEIQVFSETSRDVAIPQLWLIPTPSMLPVPLLPISACVYMCVCVVFVDTKYFTDIIPTDTKYLTDTDAITYSSFAEIIYENVCDYYSMHYSTQLNSDVSR